MFCVFNVIYLSIGLVHGIPTNYLQSSANINDNNIPSESIKLYEIERKPLNNDNVEDAKVSNYHNVIKFSDSDVADFIFESPVQTSCNHDDDRTGQAMHFDLLNKDRPIWSGQYPELTQESNQVYVEQEPVKMSMDIFMNNYDDDGDELPNPILPLDFLPNNYTTYVQMTVPKAGENNYIDIFKNENNEAQLSNARPNRSEDDEYARIIAELEHDAMLNNILPTMSFLRDAVDYDKSPASQAAIFPTRTSTGCGLPILLGCKPSVSGGVLIDSNP